MKKNMLLGLTLIFGLFAAFGCEFSDTNSSSNNGGDTDTVVDGDQETGINMEDAFQLKNSKWKTSDEKTPEFIHLTWQGKADSTLTVQWQTPFIDTKKYTPKVWYMKKEHVKEYMPFHPQLVATGEGSNFTGYVGGDEKKYVLWVAEITDLEPNTEYIFRAGTWDDVDETDQLMANPDISEEITYKTALEKGAKDKFSFMSCGDSRGAYAKITENIDRLAALNADFWIFNGDMTNFAGIEEWRSWFTSMNPVMKNTVLMPVEGNHEGFNSELYYQQFALPKEKDLEKLDISGTEYNLQEYAWSFDYGNAHFIGINSVSEGFVKAQIPWVEKDLKKASEDENIDWIIAMFHHPAYSASKKHGSTGRLQKYLVPVLEKYNVDLAFAGHDHNYERSCAIREENCKDDGNGIVYVVVGGFYSDGYSNGEDWWTVKSAHGDLHNYMMITVEDKNLTAIAYDGAGTELDKFILKK